MASSIRSAKLLTDVKDVLLKRMFNERQIENIIPRLHNGHFEQPSELVKIIDTWNDIMGSARLQEESSVERNLELKRTPKVAKPPGRSLLGTHYKEVDMTTILGDVEPDLLLLDPKKLIARHNKINGLGLTQNLGEQWTLLYNAPRGFYLQDWLELSKKLYYIEHKLVSFLYDKKELREMTTHPMLKSASIVEADFDHIRTRYLFAERSGYKTLGFLYDVQTALDKPKLGDIVTSDIDYYMSKFAPYCTMEEYSAFSELIKHNDFDQDDAEVFEKLAELESI